MSLKELYKGAKLIETIENYALVQKTVIVYHPRRIKVSHPRRVKVNHLRRMKVNQ